MRPKSPYGCVALATVFIPLVFFSLSPFRPGIRFFSFSVLYSLRLSASFMNRPLSHGLRERPAMARHSESSSNSGDGAKADGNPLENEAITRRGFFFFLLFFCLSTLSLLALSLLNASLPRPYKNPLVIPLVASSSKHFCSATVSYSLCKIVFLPVSYPTQFPYLDL